MNTPTREISPGQHLRDITAFVEEEVLVGLDETAPKEKSGNSVLDTSCGDRACDIAPLQPAVDETPNFDFSALLHRVTALCDRYPGQSLLEMLELEEREGLSNAKDQSNSLKPYIEALRDAKQLYPQAELDGPTHIRNALTWATKRLSANLRQDLRSDQDTKFKDPVKAWLYDFNSVRHPFIFDSLPRAEVAPEHDSPQQTEQKAVSMGTYSVVGSSIATSTDTPLSWGKCHDTASVERADNVSNPSTMYESKSNRSSKRRRGSRYGDSSSASTWSSRSRGTHLSQRVIGLPGVPGVPAETGCHANIQFQWVRHRPGESNLRSAYAGKDVFSPALGEDDHEPSTEPCAKRRKYLTTADDGSSQLGPEHRFDPIPISKKLPEILDSVHTPGLRTSQASISGEIAPQAKNTTQTLHAQESENSWNSAWIVDSSNTTDPTNTPSIFEDTKKCREEPEPDLNVWADLQPLQTLGEWRALAPDGLHGLGSESLDNNVLFETSGVWG